MVRLSTLSHGTVAIQLPRLTIERATPSVDIFFGVPWHRASRKVSLRKVLRYGPDGMDGWGGGSDAGRLDVGRL